ncbi:MAG: DUF3568 family protein [Desulfobacterales bacterium]|nr:DUF3568 family protein [Desulfobacterales bacterium]
MWKKRLALGLVFALLFTNGCAVIIAGVGAGAGVYTYVRGELKRTYPVTVAPALKASLAALDDLKIQIDRKQSDGIVDTIEAKRSDGTPVVIRVAAVTPTFTEVSVRTGVLGVWDKEVSELIHATIAQRLQ